MEGVGHSHSWVEGTASAAKLLWWWKHQVLRIKIVTLCGWRSSRRHGGERARIDTDPFGYTRTPPGTKIITSTGHGERTWMFVGMKSAVVASARSGRLMASTDRRVIMWKEGELWLRHGMDWTTRCRFAHVNWTSVVTQGGNYWIRGSGVGVEAWCICPNILERLLYIVIHFFFRRKS